MKYDKRNCYSGGFFVFFPYLLHHLFVLFSYVALSHKRMLAHFLFALYIMPCDFSLVASLPLLTHMQRHSSVPALLASSCICSAALKGVRGHRHTLAHTQTNVHTTTKASCQFSAPLRRAATDRSSNLYVKAGQLQHTCTHSTVWACMPVSFTL